MAGFTNQALNEIKKLGATHIWYTGVIAHASQTDYSAYNIPRNHPAVIKGKVRFSIRYPRLIMITDPDFGC